MFTKKEKKEISTATKVTRSTIFRWETGRKFPKIENLIAIAQITGKNETEVFTMLYDKYKEFNNL